MSNFTVLLIGELQRIKRYNILAASLVIVLIWIGVLQFSGVEDVSNIFPLLVMLDATSMAILMIGVTMFFERQEGVLKTILVTPINKAEYVMAKTVANILMNLKSLGIIYVYALIFKEININMFALVFAVVLVSLFHSLVGFVLTFYAKDFTALLVNMMKYFFVLLVPVFLEQLKIIKSELFSNLLYAIPTKASMLLINTSLGEVASWEVILSIGYLAIASALLYMYITKKFQEFAIKESGM